MNIFIVCIGTIVRPESNISLFVASTMLLPFIELLYDCALSRLFFSGGVRTLNIFDLVEYTKMNLKPIFHGNLSDRFLLFRHTSHSESVVI